MGLTPLFIGAEVGVHVLLFGREKAVIGAADEPLRLVLRYFKITFITLNLWEGNHTSTLQ